MTFILLSIATFVVSVWAGWRMAIGRLLPAVRSPVPGIALGAALLVDVLVLAAGFVPALLFLARDAGAALFTSTMPQWTRRMKYSSLRLHISLALLGSWAATGVYSLAMSAF